MGVLTSPKQEAFVQELAKGATVMKAYAAAGYPPSKGNAYRLRLRGPVVARLAELVAARSAVVQAAAISAAEKAGVDHYWVMRRLRTNAVLSARRGDTAASNRATELIGKHLGMFIDKKQIDINVVDDSDEYLARLMEIVGARVIDVEPAPLQLENDGLKDGSASDDSDTDE
jgi:phage terminase small subunit